MGRRTKHLARKYKVHKKRIHRLKKHPFVVPVITFIVLFLLSLVLFVNLGSQTVGPGDARLVQVYVDGKNQTLPTRAPTVGDLLKRLNVTLAEKDVVEPAVDTPILEDNFKVNVYRARPVTVVEGDKKVTLLTIQTDQAKLAQEAGFSLYPEDGLEPVSPDEALREGIVGQHYTVARAPVIAVNLYGSEIPVRTRAKTVNDVFKEKNITLLPNDTVVPSLDSAVTPATKIAVSNPNKQILTIEEAIPMPEETVDDPAFPAGSRVVKQAGAPGKKIVTYDIRLENGKEVGRTLIQEIKVSDPVKQVVAKGTKVVTLTGSKADWMAAAGISPNDYIYVDYIMGRESGWRPNAVSANRCIGLGQRCNPQILINECPNWQTDPVCQLRHFSRYAGRYGGWSGAYNFWQANHWW